MPLVRIDLRRGKPPSYLRAVGDAVHRALVDCLDVPLRDHFQVINEHAPEHLIYDPAYLGVERTDDVLVVQITLSAGRTQEQKRRFYGRLAALLRENPGIRPQDVIIVLAENTREDWSFGNGEAQYVVLPKAQWK
jgi:4-oxalocrotonate tautomerase